MELPSAGVPVGLTAEEIRKQAQLRWFETAELYEIFAKHNNLNLRISQRQERPTSGAFFVIDMQRLREFKKDGHIWAKKKDGKTIQESHENLKVDGVKKLNCLYAYGETEKNFLRRIYRMIKKQEYGDVALFHYREDKEIRKNCKRGRKITKVKPQSSQEAGKVIPPLAVTGSSSGIGDHSGNQSSLPPQTANTSNLNIESAGYYSDIVNHDNYQLPLAPRFADTGNQSSIQANAQLSGSSFGIVNHENYQLPLPPKTTDSSYESNIQANAESAETKNDFFTNPATPNYLSSPATPGSPSELSDLMKYMELSSERNKENLKQGKEILGELPANSFGEEYQDHMSFQQNPLQKGWNNGKRCKTTNTSNPSNIQAAAASGGCVPFEVTENDFPPKPGTPVMPCEWLEINDLEQFQEFSFPEDSGNYIGDYPSGSIFESLLLPDECLISVMQFEWPEIDNLEELQEFTFPKDPGNYIGDYFAGSEFEGECSILNYPP